MLGPITVKERSAGPCRTLIVAGSIDGHRLVWGGKRHALTTRRQWGVAAQGRRGIIAILAQTPIGIKAQCIGVVGTVEVRVV